MTRISHSPCVEAPCSDPVLSAFELPLKRTIYPFGFPLLLETNSSDVIEAAAEVWAAVDQAFDDPPVRLCLGVQASDQTAVPQEPVTRSREHLLAVVASGDNFLVCDLHSGFAFGWVTPNTAADHPLLRYHFLVPAASTLIEHRTFAVLHGALIARNGTGIMLAGDSLAGKSTLAYACARAGWTYISDDATHLIRDRDDCYAVGDPHSIRFRPDAPQLFPELADRLATIRPNGKIAIEVLTRELNLNTAPGCVIEHVVYLNRTNAAHPRLRHLSKQEVREDWTKYNVYGTAAMRQAREQAHERLLGKQLWEMHYSGLDDAVARLERLIDSGS